MPTTYRIFNNETAILIPNNLIDCSRFSALQKVVFSNFITLTVCQSCELADGRRVNF